MEVRHTHVGMTRGHGAQGAAPVDAYTMDAGTRFSVTVWTYGATLVEVLVPDRGGQSANVTVRLPDLPTYEDRRRNPYVGAVLGRYCRCVSGAAFQLDGVEHRLQPNEGRHHVHGGPIGFDRFVWDAEAGRDGDSLAVWLRLRSPAGGQGYPGMLSAEVTYRVWPDRRMSMDYRATTTASTIVSLTNHAFWNLAGHGVVSGQRLAINASRVIRNDDDLVPLPGGPAGVAGTGLDYQAPRLLEGQRIDNFFVLDSPEWAAVLHDPGSGRLMRVATDQPGLGVFSGDNLSPAQAGLCLQASGWPDAPNRPDFPSCRLDPGSTYRHHTVHEFGHDSGQPPAQRRVYASTLEAAGR